MENQAMVYATLSVYSWSLFQFTLNLVVTRGRIRMSTSSLFNSSENDDKTDTLNLSNSLIFKRKIKRNTQRNELFNVFISLFMQDFPFLIIRSICVFKFEIVSYLLLLFTIKNLILFLLQIYRIIAICTDKEEFIHDLSSHHEVFNLNLAQNSKNIIDIAVKIDGVKKRTRSEIIKPNYINNRKNFKKSQSYDL